MPYKQHNTCTTPNLMTPKPFGDDLACAYMCGDQTGLCCARCNLCAVLFLQELLDTPNEKSPAQSEAYVTYTSRLNEYQKMVRKQALQYPPPV